MQDDRSLCIFKRTEEFTDFSEEISCDFEKMLSKQSWREHVTVNLSMKSRNRYIVKSKEWANSIIFKTNQIDRVRKLSHLIRTNEEYSGKKP